MPIPRQLPLALLRRALPSHARSYASSGSSSLPVAPPHNSRPFAAPSAFADKDTTARTGLGQVQMPNMDEVERASSPRADESEGRVVSSRAVASSRENCQRSSARLQEPMQNDLEQLTILVTAGRRTQPTAPDTYRPSSRSPDAADPLPSSVPLPSIYTAAHPSTMPGGGPSSNVTGEDVLADDNDVPPSSSSRAQGRGGHEHDSSSSSRERPLTHDEKQGLYTLAAIVSAGLGLSTLTAPRRKHE